MSDPNMGLRKGPIAYVTMDQDPGQDQEKTAGAVVRETGI